jgi:hypothetical protein
MGQVSRAENTVHGRVTWDDGAPVVGALVYFHADQSRIIETVNFTNHEGYYRIDDIPASQRGWVVATLYEPKINGMEIAHRFYILATKDQDNNQTADIVMERQPTAVVFGSVEVPGLSAEEHKNELVLVRLVLAGKPGFLSIREAYIPFGKKFLFSVPPGEYAVLGNWSNRMNVMSPSGKSFKLIRNEIKRQDISLDERWIAQAHPVEINQSSH